MFFSLSQVSAPDHFGYCTVTPDVEITEGFYNFSAAQLKAFSERFKGQESIDGLLMSEKFCKNNHFKLFFLLIKSEFLNMNN